MVERLSKQSRQTPFQVLAAVPVNDDNGADGPLSDDHLAVYAMGSKYGAKFTFVPYSGGAPANKAFQSGEVEIAATCSII